MDIQYPSSQRLSQTTIEQQRKISNYSYPHFVSVSPRPSTSCGLTSFNQPQQQQHQRQHSAPSRRSGHTSVGSNASTPGLVEDAEEGSEVSMDDDYQNDLWNQWPITENVTPPCFPTNYAISQAAPASLQTTPRVFDSEECTPFQQPLPGAKESAWPLSRASNAQAPVNKPIHNTASYSPFPKIEALVPPPRNPLRSMTPVGDARPSTSNGPTAPLAGNRRLEHVSSMSVLRATPPLARPVHERRESQATYASSRAGSSIFSQDDFRFSRDQQHCQPFPQPMSSFFEEDSDGEEEEEESSSGARAGLSRLMRLHRRSESDGKRGPVAAASKSTEHFQRARATTDASPPAPLDQNNHQMKRRLGRMFGRLSW